MATQIKDEHRAKDPKIVEEAQRPLRMARWATRAIALLVLVHAVRAYFL